MPQATGWQSKSSIQWSQPTPPAGTGSLEKSPCSGRSPKSTRPHCSTPTSTLSGPGSLCAISQAPPWDAASTRKAACRAELLEFAAGLAEAVAALHRDGIVHRDLKPGNVLLAGDRPKIIDFGIARRTSETGDTDSGEILGSPGWISPEQFHQRTPGPAADVFAWGGLVAYAATGRRPFGAGTLRQTVERVLQGEADLHGTPSLLLPWIQAALDTNPEHRPPAAKLAAEIRALRDRYRAPHDARSWASINSR